MQRFLLLLFSLLCIQLNAQIVDFNENCQNAYQNIVAYKLEEGQKFINKESLENPENAILPYLQNYVDFLTIFISEDPYVYQKSVEEKDDRLEFIANIENRESPYYTYCRGEIQLQWAFIHLKFGEYFKAAVSLYKANQLLMDTKENHPDFIPVNKSLGLIHAIVGTIPDNYHWMIKMVGFSGTIEEGTQELLQVVNNTESNNIFQEEASILYVFALLYLHNDSQQAWVEVSKLHELYPENLILRYAAGQVAIHNGEPRKAIELLEGHVKEQYAPFPFLDFIIGTCKLNTLDPYCKRNLTMFVEAHKGKQYLKEAYMKLAWNAALHDDEDEFEYYRQKCLKEGSIDSESDEYAQIFCSEEGMPDIKLLRARLLFDGGDYKNASKELAQVENKLQEEYLYRNARIHQKIDSTQEAIVLYKELIDNKENEGYFKANSLLQLGLIYEKTNPELAEFYLERCLKMKDFPYVKSIHTKAKACKQRINA